MHVINGCSADNVMMLKNGKPAETLSVISVILTFSYFSLIRCRYIPDRSLHKLEGRGLR